MIERGLVRAWIRSRHLELALLGAAVIACSGLASHLAGGTTVMLPVFVQPIPIAHLTYVVAPMVMGPVLQDRFGLLERTLPRALVDRALAAACALGLALVSISPALSAPSAPVSTLVALLLIGFGMASVVVLGPLSWVAQLIVGLSVIAAEWGVPNQPISHAVESLGPLPPVVATTAFTVLYVLRGPSALAPRMSIHRELAAAPSREGPHT